MHNSAVRARYAVLALSLGCLLTACSSGGKEAPAVATTSAVRAPLPQVVTDCEHFAQRPLQILVACGDGNYRLTDADYQSWTAHEAAGTAVAETNDCTPDCSRGHFVRIPVRLQLDQPMDVFGIPAFTRLSIRDASTGRLLLTAPLLPLGCSVTPPSCPPSPPS